MHIPSINELIFGLIFLELLLGALFVIPLKKGWKNKLLNFIDTNHTMKQIMQYH